MKLKFVSKIFILFTIFICFDFAAEAQERKMEFSITAGILLNHDEFDDFEYGGHLGVNLYNRNEKRFKSDIQLSFNFSGSEYSSTAVLSFNGLYGFRYYSAGPNESKRIFANALIGGSLAFGLGDDFSENLSGLGYSFGLFADLNRFIMGASIESYNNFIFKLGYTF